MSRVSASITNAKYSAFLFIVTAFLGFYSRDFFLQHLGPDFMGVVAILHNIIGVIGVAELGIATSISYRLYKPILNIEENKEEINQVMGLFGFLYKRVAIFILISGVVISLFLKNIIADDTFSTLLIYYLFFLFLLNSVIVFIFNFQQIIFRVDQSYYKIQIFSLSINIIKIITQMVVLFYTKNFFIWGFIELMFPVIYSLILKYKLNLHYPWLKTQRTFSKAHLSDYNEIITKIKQVVFHKVGTVMLTNTDNLFINWYSGLKTVTYYNNYLIISHTIRVLLSNLLVNLQSSIGNLIAVGNKENTLKIYFEAFVLKFFIASILSITLFVTIDSFMILWLKNPEYVLPKSTLYFVVILFFITEIREITDNFITGFGLFQDTNAIIVEFGLNLILSIILGYYFGLNGVLMGTLISCSLVILLWKPYFLFKNGFNTNIHLYAKKFTLLFLIFLAVLWFISVLPNYTPTNFLQWMLYAATIFLITVVLTALPYFILTSEFKISMGRILKLIKNKLK